MQATNGRIADRYRKDGFLSGIRVVDEADAAQYQENYNALEAEVGVEKCRNRPRRLAF